MKWIIVILTFVIAGLTSSCLQVFTPEPVQGLVDTTAVTTAVTTATILLLFWKLMHKKIILIQKQSRPAHQFSEQESTAVPEKVKPIRKLASVDSSTG